MVDTSELQIRTMEQLLEDFDGEVESALKMKNLIYTLFQRPSGPEDGSEVPVADQGGTQVDGVWSSDSGGPILPPEAAIATDGVATTVVDASGTQAQATIEVGNGAITSVGLTQTSNCIVEDGDTTMLDGATITLDVSAGDLTGATLPATSSVASDGDTVTVMDAGGGQAQATIAVGDGAIALVGLAQTSECIIQNGASTTAMAMSGSTAPVSISVLGGNVDGVTLTQGTDTIVSDGETFPVTGTGTTATIEVANGSISIVLS